VTADHARAGQETARAVIHYRIALTDTDARGNLGLDGYDEETDTSDRVDSADQARAWCEAWTADSGVAIDSALIYSGRWEAIDYVDPHGVRTLDAEPVETLDQEGILTDLGWIWTRHEESRA
jgi:hypothetical protein